MIPAALSGDDAPAEAVNAAHLAREVTGYIRRFVVDPISKVNAMSVENKVRSYILENYLFTNDESALNSHDSFLDKGILDSTGILEVIYFLEAEFDIKIKDEEMLPENLDSVTRICDFVDRKQAH